MPTLAPLKRRLSLPPQRSTHPLSGIPVPSLNPTARTTRSSKQLPTHLPHPLLLLHSDHVLLLRVGEREGHADQQGRDRDGPSGAAAEEKRRLNDPGGGLELVPDPAACSRGDDVAEGEEAVGECLGGGVKVAVGGDLGVWGGRGVRLEVRC